MPSRLTTDQNSVFVLGMMSGMIALSVSGIAGAHDVAASALSASTQQTSPKHVLALPPPPEPAAVAPSAIIINQRAAVRIDDGTVKFFFPSGKSDIARGARQALKDVLAGTQGGQHVKISGFHDNIGDPESNAELAKQRAIAVKKELMKLGVPEGSIQLVKPEITAATGSNAQARRVEVTLLDK